MFPEPGASFIVAHSPHFIPWFCCSSSSPPPCTYKPPSPFTSSPVLLPLHLRLRHCAYQVARGVVMRVYVLEFADALILSCAYIRGVFELLRIRQI
ncbi:hypothetical protein ACSBR2_004378 [Camellia fascicularis]